MNDVQFIQIFVEDHAEFSRQMLPNHTMLSLCFSIGVPHYFYRNSCIECSRYAVQRLHRLLQLHIVSSFTYMGTITINRCLNLCSVTTSLKYKTLPCFFQAVQIMSSSVKRKSELRADEDIKPRISELGKRCGGVVKRRELSIVTPERSS